MGCASTWRSASPPLSPLHLAQKKWVPTPKWGPEKQFKLPERLAVSGDCTVRGRLPAYSLGRSSGGVGEWLHVRHEEVAAFAAGAEAHLTGELAVCAGSCGPGNLHLINGLFDCHRSRVPVLAIAAQIPSAEIGSGYFQETHPEILFRECSHYCELVSGPDQMPRTVEIAIREAVGKRGVSVIVLPGDVALQTASDAPAAQIANLMPPAPVIMPARKDLDRLATTLNNAGRITMLCGSGCQGAHDRASCAGRTP